MARVICLGILVADVIGRPIARVPDPGALELVPSITPHIGGCAANTGIGLQKLGVETAVVGAVGRDGFGAFVRQTLESHRVCARGLVEVPDAPTSATMVLVEPGGERAFLHSVGANALLTETDFSRLLHDEELWRDAELLHIAGHGLMPAFDGEHCARVLQKARAMGLQTSLDTAGAPDENWARNLRHTLPHLDFFVPSLHEVRDFCPGSDSPESIARTLLAMGVGTVALKMGGAGSFALDARGETARASALQVAAVDTTGAGDAFAAGFLAAKLRGLPLQNCLEMGNAAGACCVQAVGTVAGLRDWEGTQRLLSA